MTVNHVRNLFAITLVFAVAGGTRAWSQDSVKPKDEALDSLIEKLANPDAKHDSKPVKRAEPAKRESPKGRASAKSKPGPAAPTPKQESAKGSTGQPTKPPTAKPKGAEPVTSKDQELDSFLEKLSETKDVADARDRPQGGSARASRSPNSRRVPTSRIPPNSAARTKTSTIGSRSPLARRRNARTRTISGPDRSVRSSKR